ncbi:MAG: heparinase [Bacteroidetes bacterium]|nr:MAG: heparinase [Bacteroidota bacterium]
MLAQQHPSLILTREGVAAMRAEQAGPLFERAVAEAVQQVEAAMQQGIQVPLPKDMAGGYTHEQHKRNYRSMLLAGSLYQIQGKKEYADFVKAMLLEYARIFPSLTLHPAEKSYARGKLFWQCLNDANWLVYTAQAYDAVYEYLSAAERRQLETQLFRPYADFLSVENPRFFNRIHNHSTWGNAAVGMIAIVMRDEELLQRALYGLPLRQRASGETDNDGGYIYEKGQSRAGFLAQIDYAFSPDGYYTEGPYYQRYAMTPFMLFAQALDHYRPELNIFAYRDSLLIRAVYALLQQTDEAGVFFPINDAQKGMSFMASSVITAVNIAYGQTQDPQLVDIARQQGTVSLDQNGFALASALQQGQLRPFRRSSVMLRDGADGSQGALAIMRASNTRTTISVPFKCTAQGLGHGHYDKLAYCLYDGATEVLQDYGAARWVNIDQKAGGRYLPENNSWAKQSLAHNTLVVDGRSHFGGQYELASQHHSEIRSYDFGQERLQFVSAREVHAYEGLELYRSLVLWQPPQLYKPILIDLLQVVGEGTHQFDLPFHHAGQLLDMNVAYQTAEPPEVMGEAHGYQHVYAEARAAVDSPLLRFNWIKDQQFYTLTALAEAGDQAILARIGAHDPHFNLRRDAFLIHRKPAAKNPVFLTILEPHGSYDPVSEIPTGPFSQVAGLERLHIDRDYAVFSIRTSGGSQWTFMLYTGPEASTVRHQLSINGNQYEWEGRIAVQSVP